MAEKLTCSVRVVASWLTRDLICVREPHTIGAHRTPDGGVFLVTSDPKPPLLKPQPDSQTPRKRVRKIVRRKRV
jgi:hypothetical protein